MRKIVFLGVVLSCGLAWAADPAAWDQWRGPARDGTLPSGAAVWPDDLGENHLQRVWRRGLDEGYSTPIVTPDRVFTVETVDNKREVVRAFGLADGQEVWNTNWTGAMQVPFFARRNGSWVRSSPAFDGSSLYVGGMRDLLVCIDPTTGRERWRVDFMQRYKTPLPDFGFVSSPLVDGEFVFAQAGASLVKLDRRTGDEVWRTLADGGGMFGSAFSSPMIATLHGQRQLVVQTRAKLAGVNMDDGTVLWSVDVPAFRGMNILNPTVRGNQVFTSSYGGGAFLFDILKDGKGWSARQAWKTKTEGYMASPVVLDGHIYLHRRDRRVSCIEWATGREAWTSDERFGQYWSMLTDGRRILALDQKGELLLVEATPREMKIVARRTVSAEETWAHLAAMGDYLVIRELKGVSVWRWKR